MKLLIKQLIDRYSNNALEYRQVWIAAAAIALLGSLLLIVRWPRRVPAWVTLLLTLPVVAGALFWGWKLAWVGDDAFISFRYADNWARGLGPVWNPGERVEGYTNFLWMAYAALAIRVGLSPVEAALALSLLCFVGVIAVVTRLVRKLSPAGAPVTISFAAAAVGGNYVLASYATSGLETMFCALLVLLAVERATAGKPLAAGICGIAATMGHPDHAIFYVSLGAVLLLEKDRRRLLIRYAAPFVLVYLPYFAWRYHYYGELLPNTYHAKEAGRVYFTQGVDYLVVSAAAANAIAVVPFAVFGLLTNFRTILARFAYLAVPVYLIHVGKIGGDFMLGRLLVSVLPFVLILAELGARRIFSSRYALVRVLALPAVAAVMLAGVPVRLLIHLEKPWHIADERNFYPLKSLRPLKIGTGYFEVGNLFRRRFTDKGLYPCYATGCPGILGYMSRLPIFDTYGLNDWTIARKKLLKRSRPGHEKTSNHGDALQRGVDFADYDIYPEPYLGMTKFWLEKDSFFWVSFRPELIDRVIGDRAFRMQDIRPVIDGWDPLAPGIDQDKVACDAWFFSMYYFRNADDEPRRTSLLRRMVRADPSLAGLEELLLEPRDSTRQAATAGAHRNWKTGAAAVEDQLAQLQRAGWEIVAREGFDDLTGWERTGDAFVFAPTRSSIPDQGTVAYRVGPFVNSWHARVGDEPVGTLRSPPFTIQGDVIMLRVGGGLNGRQLRVSLVSNGEPLMNATGCNTEVLGRRVWNVSNLRGESVTLEIVDELRGGWGHIVVDELVQLRRPAKAAARAHRPN